MNSLLAALLAPLALVWALSLLSDGRSLFDVIGGFRGRRFLGIREQRTAATTKAWIHYI